MRKACKRHRCCECGGAIVAGDKYSYETGVWDGKWSVFKTCMSCMGIRTWSSQFNEPKGSYMYRSLLGDLSEGLLYDIDARSLNMMLTMLYTRRRFTTDWSENHLPDLYDRIIKSLRIGKPYNVIDFPWPFDHVKRITRNSSIGTRIGPDSARTMLQDKTTYPGDVLCTAMCGGFEVTAVIDNEELLDIFLDPMDIRPKVFLAVGTSLVRWFNNRYSS